MSVLTALARAKATEQGRAQRLVSVRHTHLSDRPLVVIPLRMAGETAAPLAFMVGSDPDAPTLLVAHQPRDRALRFRFLDDLAGQILPYFESCRTAPEVTVKKSGEESVCFGDAPQLLVPNPGGATFLRLLGRSTRFRRIDGPYAVPERVPLLGRWLTWLAGGVDKPGSATLLSMTSLLSAHWATGQSGLEDGNLAALLGWIDPPPGLTGPAAAALAEDPVKSPPSGPATDPGFDNEELKPLMDAYDAAADDRTRELAAERLEQAIRTQLEPTWQLMWRGVDIMRSLPPGASVATRWARDRNSFSWFAVNLEETPPQARRDAAVPAVRNLLKRERALDEFDAQRAFDDPWVMAEHRLIGDACAAVVVEIDPLRTVSGSGTRKMLRPSIRVRILDEAFRASLGDEYVCVERPKQKATVIDIDSDTVELELSGGMGRKLIPDPGSIPQEGDRIGLARFSPSSGHPMPTLPPREETPWTHGGPPEEWVPTEDDAQEEWS
ncbi:hypothetical protein [Nocardia jejuensis]|uniref:hypothetical protein n=1 Tax=Nocardia jejuensis TaxID=328049 RepID=UPI00082AD840|nr:hypothetical protein [Nocardia jejuensis]